MISYMIRFSLKHKLIILLFMVAVVAFGIYALIHIPIGAVPDVTNNQVQVITTSRNLSTQDVEQFITYPVELEMANLPGVKEIRSISKFGLSVVTIVFEDRMGTYLPRQLIAEKIKRASENIPEGFGEPEMGPISTGLGEIYQYVLEVDEAHKGQYTTMELRTIQDWIVKRQLSGIPGVVEVNTWGGFLKQYEVSLDPVKLRSLDLAVSQVFEALERNNGVAGGGYIEKSDQAYFIRGEGLTKSLEDIEHIVVVNRGGIPIYVKDIARVQFGSATRFGAITGNGEGEKVLGQVMMLKGASSKEVIEAVTERVAEIQHSLPEGIAINAFLERSKLIGKTTATISENLILGCLIVIFVVVMLLGNFRSGLVVASVIPLSLLFAISLMYLFGVDANLMSLGAIDFGIIIDGAVIIVEYISFTINAQYQELGKLSRSETRSKVDEITFSSTHKMMHSAIFGQLIIIIVFIPILSLTNVEGKMFQPMALTFSFALIGTMLFCFTYVPVISSLVLRPTKGNFSSRLIRRLQNGYQGILASALRFRQLVLGVALLMLLGTIYLFSTLGAEFVPTLDEGDFVIQPVLPTGTSLSRTVEIITDIERVIGRFPEVDQVVTRIGAAEVPTDPMSMEETDVIITLHPKSGWVTAGSKDELANKIKDALVAAIPEVDYEFTQPIEMRFNELITGVRADLAIKVFGEDLEILANKGNEIEKLITQVDGAADITVEKVDGLPQMSVAYQRDQIAMHGLNIADVNEVISMGFAGKVAGSVFEGERRFDLVLRYDEHFRTDITHLRNAYVTTPNGRQVPLRELAKITYTTGPAQISRDDTRRRIVVSVNVRDRDLGSVKEEVESILNAKLDLPAGYYLTYGGQFENLESARKRLTLAVPIALVLIFILLYFAFNSIQKVLMIYSAIPLSAVGGVLFLWLRGMPFSISAGVGFIALFGIAVLNGIVLMEHYKHLHQHSDDSIKDLVIHGSVARLRPVLLTAAAAALGFLPMAISTSAGAEVQRPLATVVIGGLITATLLTLIVLPVLYFHVENRKVNFPANPKMLAFLLLSLPFVAQAQETLTLERAIELAKTNNAGLNSAQLKVKQAEALLGTSWEIDPMTVYHSYDENNIAPNDAPLRVWGIQQNFRFPTVYSNQLRLQKSQVSIQENELRMEEQFLAGQVSQAFYQIIYLKNLQARYQYLDSAYARFASSARQRVELGEAGKLELLTAISRQNEVRLSMQQAESELAQAYHELQSWLQVEESFEVVEMELARVPVLGLDTSTHPGLTQYELRQQSAAMDLARQQKNWLPDIQLEYFQGSNALSDAQTYRGFQVGVGIPVFYRNIRSQINAVRIEQDRLASERNNYTRHLHASYQQLLLELELHDQALKNYESTGSELSRSLIAAANRLFETGEIDFFKYLQSLDSGLQIEIEYLHNLRKYNETALSINYLLN